MSAHALPKLLPDAEDLDLRLTRALAAVRAFVRKAACAVGGHDYRLHASANRICLRCADCEHETPGWRLDARVARRTAMSPRTRLETERTDSDASVETVWRRHGLQQRDLLVRVADRPGEVGKAADVAPCNTLKDIINLQEPTMVRATARTTHRTDAEIFAQARKALDERPSIPATVRVHIDDGTAWLTGTVRLASERVEAEDVVRQVPGVLRIVNKISVTQTASPEGFEPPDTSV